MASELRLVVAALVVTGCGTFSDDPRGRFTAEVRAPISIAARALPSREAPRECIGPCLATGAPTVHCSVSDAVLGVQVQASGCARPRATVFDYGLGPSAPELATGVTRPLFFDTFVAAVPLAEATSHLLPSPEPSSTGVKVLTPTAPIVSAAVSCESTQPAVSIEVPFVVEVDGLETRERVELASCGRLSAIVPLDEGFVVAGERGARCLSSFEPDDTLHATLRQSGLVTDVRALGDRAVVIKRLEDATFWGDVALAVSCDGSATFGGPGAPMQFIDALERLGDRLILVGRASDGLVLASTTALFADVQSQRLPDSEGAVVHSLGALTDGSVRFVYASRAQLRFMQVTVQPSGTVEVAPLATFGDAEPPAGELHTWTSPRATSFVHGHSDVVASPWVGTVVSPLHARDVDAPSDRWTSAWSASRLFFARDLVLVPGLTGLVALDVATGEQRWRYAVPLSSAHQGPELSTVQLVGDTLVYTQRRLEPQFFEATTLPTWNGEVATLSLDGEPRFALPALPRGLTPSSPFFADARGHLYGTTSNALVRLTLQSPQLEAPATRCSRLDCGAGEVDLSSDPANCGRCGVGCFAGQRCVAGTCR